MNSIDKLKSFVLCGLRGRFCPQFWALLAVLALAGCSGTVPPPPPPPPPVECPENERPDEGVCVCVDGFTRDGAGRCVPLPPPPPPPPPVDPPPPPPPPTECGENERPEDGACVCVPGYIRDPLGNCARPQDYIPWATRDEWARKVDLAYTVWRGDRDLQTILDFGRCHLSDGSKATLDVDGPELEAIIAEMRDVRDEGDFLIHRIETDQHRFFDEGPPWLRSQARKSRANEMVEALDEQTAIYAGISAQFGPVPGCDAIACKIGKDPCLGGD